MIIVGAGGFAKELVDILVTDYNLNKENTCFFDEIDQSKKLVYGFKVLHSIAEVKSFFEKNSHEYCLGVGSPKSRYNLWKKFEKINGQLTSITHSAANIGKFDVKIGEGVCIMANSSISNGTSLGKGALINADVLVGHDVTIGNFCDISPGVKLTGHSCIGKYVTIGAGAVILPKVKIGDNSFIAAGSTVSNDIPENSMVVGIIPSRVVSKLPDFEE